MFDTPGWLSAAISSKFSERIAEANRLSNESIASANRESNENIAALNRASNELIGQRHDEANMYAADLQYASAVAQRELEEKLQNERIASNEKIAFAQITSTENIAEKERNWKSEENALQRALTASEGELNRENALKVASINAAANTGGNVIRIIPALLPTKNSGNSNNNKGTPQSNIPLPATVKEETKAESTRKKADSLFPDLEPTFSSSTVWKNLLPMAGAILLSGLGSVSTFVPML